MMSQSAVDLQEIEPGIALVIMQDRVSKNAFSAEIVSGLFRAFETIENSQNFKVVILTGYDNYFSSGGTQEALLEEQEGKATFLIQENGKNLHSLLLECKIPAIAAMQGHGIGGGFVLGLYADIVILGRESVYTTSFMKYGFTPGFGATLIVPEKLGIGLAEDLLFTTINYRGIELEKRGIPFRVLPREEVMKHAIELARQLAEKPRLSLITLKDHLVGSIREKLPGVIEKELLMHKQTFHQPEVKERLMSLFGK